VRYATEEKLGRGDREKQIEETGDRSQERQLKNSQENKRNRRHETVGLGMDTDKRQRKDS